MNEIIQIIKQRRNTKNFVDKDVAKIDIETLLDAAIWAPNHRDTQPWRFVNSLGVWQPCAAALDASDSML